MQGEQFRGAQMKSNFQIAFKFYYDNEVGVSTLICS